MKRISIGLTAFSLMGVVAPLQAPPATAATTWWTKCNVVQLNGEATLSYVYGKGKDRASAQAVANKYVPRGHRAKHCSERSLPTNKIPSKILKAGGGYIVDFLIPPG